MRRRRLGGAPPQIHRYRRPDPHPPAPLVVARGRGAHQTAAAVGTVVTDLRGVAGIVDVDAARHDGQPQQRIRLIAAEVVFGMHRTLNEDPHLVVGEAEPCAVDMERHLTVDQPDHLDVAPVPLRIVIGVGELRGIQRFLKIHIGRCEIARAVFAERPQRTRQFFFQHLFIPDNKLRLQ